MRICRVCLGFCLELCVFRSVSVRNVCQLCVLGRYRIARLCHWASVLASDFVAFSLHGDNKSAPVRAHDLDGSIVAVDEFQVASALLAGELDILNQEIDSQHLFTLCCRFGLYGTAAPVE